MKIAWPRPRRGVAVAALAMALATGAGARAASLQECERGDLYSRISACDVLIADPKTDNATRAVALVSRGYAVYTSTSETDEPLANFSNATLIDPNNAGAFIGLGTMHFVRKELDQAEAAFNTAIKLAPNDANVWNSLGTLYDARGNNEEALANYDKALTLNKRLPAANLNKADTLVKMGRKGEALAVYRFCLYLFDQRAEQYSYARDKIELLEAELKQ